MFLYGFEVEGFYQGNADWIPPKNYPTDGFPGLVEFRTENGSSLEDCYAQLCGKSLIYSNVSIGVSSTVFNRKAREEFRRRWLEKGSCDIQNLYGKRPRLLGNKTIASFQINISYLLSKRYTDNKGSIHSERYGALDVPRIVRNLDTEFSKEIQAAGRQKGEYAIKDNIRLEYRSLPNSVFNFNPNVFREVMRRIKMCVEEK